MCVCVCVCVCVCEKCVHMDWLLLERFQHELWPYTAGCCDLVTASSVDTCQHRAQTHFLSLSLSLSLSLQRRAQTHTLSVSLCLSLSLCRQLTRGAERRRGCLASCSQSRKARGKSSFGTPQRSPGTRKVRTAKPCSVQDTRFVARENLNQLSYARFFSLSGASMHT